MLTNQYLERFVARVAVAVNKRKEVGAFTWIAYHELRANEGVIIFANIGICKICQVIFKANVKDAVVFNSLVQLLTKWLCPELGFVTPSAIPLASTPRVFDLQEPDLLAT